VDPSDSFKNKAAKHLKSTLMITHELHRNYNENSTMGAFGNVVKQQRIVMFSHAQCQSRA